MTLEYEINPLGQPVGLPLHGWAPPQAPPHIALNGRFCRLEPLDAEQHTEDLWAANSLDVEGRNWTYMGYGPFETIEAYREWVTVSGGRTDQLFYAIIERATSRAVGVFSYLRIDPPNGAIEIGNLVFSPLLQRTTAATEAIYLMIENAFALGYRRVEWKCNALNAPSRRAALRYGFSYEGLFRQAVVVKGRNRDTTWFSIIDPEWPAIRSAFRQWLSPSNFDAENRQIVALSELTAPLLKSRE